MKNIRGFKLILLGIVFYMPYFIWSSVAETVPTLVFIISMALFSICFLVGAAQILFKKDDALDDDMMKEVRANRENNVKKGIFRLDNRGGK